MDDTTLLQIDHAYNLITHTPKKNGFWNFVADIISEQIKALPPLWSWERFNEFLHYVQVYNQWIFWLIIVTIVMMALIVLPIKKHKILTIMYKYWNRCIFFLLLITPFFSLFKQTFPAIHSENSAQFFALILPLFLMMVLIANTPWPKTRNNLTIIQNINRTIAKLNIFLIELCILQFITINYFFAMIIWTIGISILSTIISSFTELKDNPRPRTMPTKRKNKYLPPEEWPNSNTQHHLK